MDLESLDKWEAYTEAKEEMFVHTDTNDAPWYTVKSNDKKRARVNALRLFLSLVEYEGKDEQVVLQPDPLLVQRGREAVGD
jgi:polyphosphate kinase 2 (PPK2 family)